MAIFDKIVKFAQRNEKKNSAEGEKKKKKRQQEQQEQQNKPQQDNSIAGTASRIINKAVNNDNQDKQVSYSQARADQVKKVNAQLQNAKKEKQEQEERKQQVNKGVSAKTQRQRDDEYQKIKDAATELKKQRDQNNQESTTSNGGTLSQSTASQKKPVKANQVSDKYEDRKKQTDHSQDKFGLSDQYYKADEMAGRLKHVKNYDKDKEGDFANRMLPEQQKTISSGIGAGTDSMIQMVGTGTNALGKATHNKKLADIGVDIAIAADPTDRTEKLHYNNKFANTLGGKLVEQISQQLPSMALGAAAGMVGLPADTVSLLATSAGAYGSKTFENMQKLASDNMTKRASALQNDIELARNAGDIAKYNQLMQKYNDLVNPLNYEKNLRDEMYNLNGNETFRANLSGAISGATEYATEKIPFNKIIPGMSANTLPWQAQGLGDILEEGIEEFAGDFTNPLQDAALNGTSVKDEYKQQLSSSDFWKNALKDAAMGSATAGLMAGGNIAEGVASGKIDPNQIREYNQLTKEARNDKADMRRADMVNRFASLGTDETKAKLKSNYDSYTSGMYKKYMTDENGNLSNLALNSGVDAIKENARELNRKYITEYAAEKLNLNEKDAKALAHLSNKAGVAVEVADKPLEIDGNKVDSMLNSNGAIQISPDAKSPVTELFVRELTNATQGTKSYNELSDALKNMYDNGQIEVDKSTYDQMSDQDKTAYLASKALSDTKTLEQLATDHKGLAQIVSDKITDLTNGTSAELSNAKKVMDKVIAQAPEQAFNKSAEAYTNVANTPVDHNVEVKTETPVQNVEQQGNEQTVTPVENQVTENVKPVTENAEQTAPADNQVSDNAVEQPQTAQNAQPVQNEQNIEQSKTVENQAQEQAKQAPKQKKKATTVKEKSEKLTKASKGNDANAETNAATEVMKVMKDSKATSEQRSHAEESVAKALEDKLPDMPAEDKKDIAKQAARKINQTIETKIKSKDTPKSSKQEYKKMVEDVPDSVSHLVLNFREYNKSASELWETDRDNTLKGLMDYTPKILDPKTSSVEEMDANRAEATQAFSTIQYFQDQYEDLVEQNRQKFVKNKKSTGEFYNSKYHLKTDVDGTWTLYDRKGNVVDDANISTDAKKAIQDMNEWVRTKDDLLEKKSAWLDMSATLMGVASHGNAAFDEMSPAGRRRMLEKEVKAINDDLKKKFPKDTKARIVLTESENALVDTIARTTDLSERQKALGELQESIGKRIPAAWYEKVDAFRNTMLLSAPITWVRNDVGNVGSSGMFKLADGSGSLIEKILRARGEVRNNTLDLSNDADVQLVKKTNKVAGKALVQVFNDAKKSGNMQNYLKQLSPDNYKEFLKATKKFDKPNKYGTSFDPYDNSYRYNIVTEQAAMHLRDQGFDFNDKGQIVKLDDNGNVIKNADGKDIIYDSKSKEIQQIAIQSWHEAVKQKYDARQFVNTTESGKNTYANDYKTFRNYTKAISEGKVLQGRFNDQNNIEGTSLLSGVTEYARRNVFSKANPLYWVSKLENRVMNDSQIFGDAGFTGRRLARNLARYTNAQGYTVNGVTEDGYTPQLVDSEGNNLSAKKNAYEIDRITKMATSDALESTFHDVDDTTKTINKWKAKHPIGAQVSAAFMPFVGTPAAIGRRIVEFSPVGLVKSLTYDRQQLQNGNIDTQTYIRRLSQGTTGTAMAFVGGLMASLGMLVAKGNDKDDDKEKSFKESNGLQDYSLVLPNGTSVSLEWMAPATTPLLFGAHFYETLEKMRGGEDVTSDDLLNDTLGLMEPWVDASYMSGLMDIAENFSGNSSDSSDDNNIAAGVKSVFKNYARQFTPNEGGKLLQTFTGNKYSTYDPTFLGSVWRSAASNMFFTNMIYKMATGNDLLQKQYDLEGNDVKVDSTVFGQDLGMPGRFINTHFVPWTKKVNTYDKQTTYGTKNHKISFDNPNYDPVNSELTRIYDATKGTEVDNQYLLPKNLYKISTPDDTKFTAEQRAKYNREYLSSYRKQIEDFMNSPMYQNYTDTERVEILNKIRKMYYSKIQKEYYDELGLDSSKVLFDSTKDALTLEKMGVEPYRIYSYNEIKALKDSSGDDISNTKQMAVREAAQGAGDFDTIVNAYLDGKISDLKSAGLNRNVAAWTDTKFDYELSKMDSGTYEPKSEKADGDTAKDKFINLRNEGERLESEASNYGIPAINVWMNQDTPVTYKPDGEELSGSGYADARYNAMVNGTWDTILTAVNDGELSVEDAAKILGCGKSQITKSTKSFWSNYYKIQFQKQLIRDGGFNEDDFKQYGKYHKADFTEGQDTFDAVEYEDKEKEKRKAEYYGYDYDENADTSSYTSKKSGRRSSRKRSSSSKSSNSSSTTSDKVSNMKMPDLSYNAAKSDSDIYANTVFKPDSALKAKKIYKRSSAKKYENPFTSSRYSKIRKIASR